MHPDLLNILMHHELPIDNSTLIAYLTGKATEEQSREVEKQLANGGIDAEALEGLMLVKNRKHLPALDLELKEFVARQTKARRTSRQGPAKLWWFWVTAGTLGLLAMAALAWWIISKTSV